MRGRPALARCLRVWRRRVDDTPTKPGHSRRPRLVNDGLGSRMRLCMATTWTLPLTEIRRSLGLTMLASICEGERLERLSKRMSNACGVLALFANKYNALIVV